MWVFSGRSPRVVSLGAIASLLIACGSQEPSLKQRADEAAQTRKSHKADEEFAKSLPPTDSKPIFKP